MTCEQFITGSLFVKVYMVWRWYRKHYSGKLHHQLPNLNMPSAIIMIVVCARNLLPISVSLVARGLRWLWCCVWSDKAVVSPQRSLSVKGRRSSTPKVEVLQVLPDGTVVEAKPDEVCCKSV